ncbi:MAG TPA: hypothetical protein VGY54_11550, partial [Polyangiaceae bacterium]|nr:hypothetical protein [Polyangiaceae bacterium]
MAKVGLMNCARTYTELVPGQGGRVLGRAAPKLIATAGPAALSAVGFFAVGALTLWRRQPDEDAYILFRYAEHVARGAGIVFNASGPHAEGATDFLWLLMLSGLNALGLDVAIAALVLNSAGAGLAGYLFTLAMDRSGLSRTPRTIALALVPLCVLSLSAATAAYGGFSSMLYSALVLAGLHAGLEANARAILWVPFLALTLGVFRPEGALIGVAITWLGARRALDLARMRAYLKVTLGAG